MEQVKMVKISIEWIFQMPYLIHYQIWNFSLNFITYIMCIIQCVFFELTFRFAIVLDAIS